MVSSDVVVVGAGVVGLALARALAKSGRSVIVLEREAQIGTHTSSRNSEVIHAGFYYPPGSLKARLCVAGRDLLYAYCRERTIAHARVAKLVVATDVAQLPALEALRQRGALNGVDDLQLLDAAQVRALEPQVSALSGLFSPATGIVDSHGLLSALDRDARAAGARVSAIPCNLRSGG